MEEILKERQLDFKIEDNEWVLPSKIEIVKPVTVALERKLTRLGWKLSEVHDFAYLVFGELLANAIAHGNLGIEGRTAHIAEVAKEQQKKLNTDKKVFIKIDADENRISVTIRDEGRGFNVKKVADPTTAENKMEATGRGGFLMGHYANAVNYSEDGKEVEIVKERKS